MFLESILSVQNIIAIIITIVIIAGLFIGSYFLAKYVDKKSVVVEEEVSYSNKRKNLILDIIETSIMVALSVVFELIFKAIPFLDMPQGGSASLTMLPILVLAFRRGPKWGIIGGAVFGVINMLIDGKLYHWSSAFLDYIIAFGVIGVAGFFKPFLKKGPALRILFLIIGSVIGVFGRFVCSTLSGMIAFETPFWGSVVYNFPYIAISGLMCIIVLVIINNIIDYGTTEE